MKTVAVKGWDAIQKEMVYDFTSEKYHICIQHNGVVVIGYFDDKKDWQELELMSFIGLPDNKGKQMCEGDFLKDDMGYIGIVVHTLDSGRVSELPFSCPAFVIEWNDGDITGFSDSAHLDYEIIGNIKQNQELDFK